MFSNFIATIFFMLCFAMSFSTFAQNKVNRLVENRGGLDFEFDGKIYTGLGYGSICPHNVKDEDDTSTNPYKDQHLKKMMDPEVADVGRVLFVLGDNVYRFCVNPETGLGGFPSTWNAQQGHNFGPLFYEIERRVRHNPNLKIIVQVSIQGSKAWLQQNPNNQSDPGLRAGGIPDYADPKWKSAAEEALTALVTQIRQSPYADRVVAYELFSGRSFDNNPWHSLDSPAALASFRAFIAKKYGSDKALQAAWGQETVTIKDAMPKLSFSVDDMQKAWKLAPLFAPATFRELADTIEFRTEYDDDIVFEFARVIKSAAGKDKALVGVRSGDMFAVPWNNQWVDDRLAVTPEVRKYEICPDDLAKGYKTCGNAGLLHVFRTRKFFEDENIDFYELWDAYGANRFSGWLGNHFTPLAPVEGLRLLGKKYVLQNDYRVPFGMEGKEDKNRGFGYEDPIGDNNGASRRSIYKQGRLFSAALTMDVSPYLFEMSYNYAQPWLIDNAWKPMKQISQKSKQLDRRSVAQLAIVVDPEMQKYFSLGYPPIPAPWDEKKLVTPTLNIWMDEPGHLFNIVTTPMHSWPRIGATNDMIFLDQVESSKEDYKAFLFYHTFALSDEYIDRIHRFLSRRGAMGIFVYADGMMDEKGHVDLNNIGARISALTGMTIQGVRNATDPTDGMPKERHSKLEPSTKYLEWLNGRVLDKRRWEIPTGRFWDENKEKPILPVTVNLFPSFKIDIDSSSAQKETPLAVYEEAYGESKDVAIAMKEFAPMPGVEAAKPYRIVYSATPHIPPTLMNHLLASQGVATIVDDEDVLVHANASFIGFTSDTTKPVAMKVSGVAPNASIAKIYDVLGGTEHVVENGGVTIAAEAGRPYLFFRGDKATWTSLATTP